MKHIYFFKQKNSSITHQGLLCAKKLFAVEVTFKVKGYQCPDYNKTLI